MAGKRVYISCASQDASLLEMLTAALDAWEVTYDYLQRGELAVGSMLPANAQNAIRQAEVFLRVCTSSTISSVSMSQELHFFNALAVEDRRAPRGERRMLANVILDASYQREPFDAVTLFIDTAGKSRAYWLNELARPLGVATQAQRLGRRSAIVLGLAGGITVLAAVSAAGLLGHNQSTLASAEATATAQVLGDQLSGQQAYPPVDISSNFAAAIKLNFGNFAIGIATDGTMLYAFAPDTIKALTARGGTIWHSTAISNIVVPSVGFVDFPLPYAGGGILVFQYTDSQNNQNLTVIDSRTRKMLWQKSAVIGAVSVTPGAVTVVGSRLYCLFPIQDDWSLCSFDRLSGRLQWKYSIGLGTPHPTPTYSSGRIYIGEPYVFDCLDATTGKLIYHVRLRTTVVATVVVSGGLALFGGLDGYFYALDAASGKVRWQTDLSAPVSAQAVVSAGVVYVGDVDGYFWALDVDSGHVYWRVFAGQNESKDAGTSNAVIQYPPVVYRNVAAVAAGDTVTSVDLIHGIPRWHYSTPPADSSTRGLATGPVMLGGHLIVGDAQNHVIAINP